MSLYTYLKEYSRSGRLLMRGQGHKLKLNAYAPDLPYAIDIPYGEGMSDAATREEIAAAEERGATLWGADRAYLLTGGGGPAAALGATLCEGDAVIMSRMSRRALLSAVTLCRARPIYIMPEYDKKCAVSRCITPDEVEKAFKTDDRVRVVVVTSPTREGYVADIRTIAEITHRHGAILIVDGKYGAHLPFMMPEQRAEGLPDVEVTELAEGLPALSQTEMLLCYGERADRTKIARKLSVYEPETPSLPLLCSADAAFDWLSGRGARAFYLYDIRLSELYRTLSGLTCLSVIKNDDRSRLLISTVGTNMTARELSSALSKRYSIETAAAGEGYLLVHTSVTDGDAELRRLAAALLDIDRRLTYIGPQGGSEPYAIPERRLELYEAEACTGEYVDAEAARGRVSLDYIFRGELPVALPGELISEDIGDCDIEDKIYVLASKSNQHTKK